MENLLLSAYPKVFDGKYVEIYDLSAAVPQVAFAYWKDFFKLTSAQFVEEMFWSIEYVREKNLKAYITDRSQLQVVSQNALEWLHTTWYDRVDEYGLLAEIYLDNQNVSRQLGSQKILNRNKVGRVSTLKVQSLPQALEVARKLVAVKELS